VTGTDFFVPRAAPPARLVRMLRVDTCRALRAFPENFQPFILDNDDAGVDYESYVANVERPGTYVDHAEVVAACIVQSINLSIHRPGQKPELIVTDPSAPTYHVAYYGDEYQHYDAIHRRKSSAAQAPKSPPAVSAATSGGAPSVPPAPTVRLAQVAPLVVVLARC
jgi:FPC/CPF motif-containing protein YcgG